MTARPPGRPKTSTTNRHITCGLNKQLLETLDRLAMEMHTSRNRIMREALIEFAKRYEGLPASDPALAHIKPHLSPPPASEELARVDSRLANIERWIVQAARSAERTGLNVFERAAEHLDDPRTLSAPMRAAVDRHNPDRKNVFVETVTGPGGRR